MLAVRDATRHSLGSFSLPIYENTCFVFDHNARDCRVLRVLRPQKRNASAGTREYDDPRNVHHQEDDRDYKEERSCSRSFAISFAKEEEETRSRGIAFCQRVSFTFSDSLIGRRKVCNQKGG
jgi:hypothetical protein